CISAPRVNLARALTDFEATHVTLLPLILVSLLDNLSEDYVKPENLCIATIGAPVPDNVRKRALDRLAVKLIESYGTNEIGPICTMNADGTGTVLPGVQVEVVDEQGRPVMGQPGRVRIKSLGIIDGYLDDPETTARMFRDGWFYPGDLGLMEDADTLKLIGRADDIMNIRGLKIAPHRIEEILMEGLPVKDVGVTALPDPDGNNVVRVALVLDGSRKLADLKPQINPLLTGKLVRYEIVAVKKIPRTPTGKIQRNTLNAMLLKRD
ncbi:MAG: acyl--CoA ligase, partial [Rhodospirillales bacterium]|nr:acyl--CoA ligase [Rhodospirillales bacterium]